MVTATDRKSHQRRLKDAQARAASHLAMGDYKALVSDAIEVLTLRGVLNELDYQIDQQEAQDRRLVGKEVRAGGTTVMVEDVRRDDDGGLWVLDEYTKVWHRA